MPLCLYHSSNEYFDKKSLYVLTMLFIVSWANVMHIQRILPLFSWFDIIFNNLEVIKWPNHPIHAIQFIESIDLHRQYEWNYTTLLHLCTSRKYKPKWVSRLNPAYPSYLFPPIAMPWNSFKNVLCENHWSNKTVTIRGPLRFFFYSDIRVDLLWYFLNLLRYHSKFTQISQ